MLVSFGASFARRSFVVSSLSAWLLASVVACGGTSKPAAAPDSDPWAEYKGTFAEPNGARPKAAAPEVAKAAPAKESVGTTSAPLATADSADTSATPPAKAKTSRKKGGGVRKAKKHKVQKADAG